MYKKFLKKITPPILWDWKNYLICLLVRIKNKKILLKNKNIQNKYINQSVYILGNGPSLNNFNINEIKGAKVITMNHFELHPRKDDFKIVAHCIGEPYTSKTWEDPKPMLEGINADTYWFNIDAKPYFLKNNIFKIMN